MSEKYIRQNKNSCSIVKGSKTYAKIDNLDDAVFIRDFLVDIDWDLDNVPDTIVKDEDYLVLTVYEDKVYILARYRQKPDKDVIANLVKKHKRNPNNSKYGLNISRILDTFIITKQIAGEGHVFGMYDDLQDAEFVRNFLMDHQWNVNEFSEIEYDKESNDYKVILVIDDYVYVLDSFKTPQIDLDKTYEEFLVKVKKHKYGLADYPHLDRLKNSIRQLEDDLNITATDDMWIFEEGLEESDALSEIIFTL